MNASGLCVETPDSTAQVQGLLGDRGGRGEWALGIAVGDAFRGDPGEASQHACERRTVILPLSRGD